MKTPWRLDNVYYGWVLVGTLSFTEMVSWGILYYAFAVFLVPMQEELDWSRVTLTGAFSLALLVAGIAGVPVGGWLDRHGPRLLMTIGSSMSWARTWFEWQLYPGALGTGVNIGFCGGGSAVRQCERSVLKTSLAIQG